MKDKANRRNPSKGIKATHPPETPPQIGILMTGKAPTGKKIPGDLRDTCEISTLPNTSDGEKPFDRGAANEAEWRAILKRIKDLYHVDVKDGLTIPLDKMFLPIDFGIDFNSETTSGGVKVATADDFRPSHVEPLLDQAADLLDRGLRMREEYNDLAVRGFDIGREIVEYAALDEIHQREIASGFYTIDYKVSHADNEAEDRSVSCNWYADWLLLDLLTEKFSPDQVNKLISIAGLMANNAVLHNYDKEIPAGSKPIIYTVDIPGEGTQAWSRTRAAFELAKRQAEQDLTVEETLLGVQRQNQGTAATISEEKRRGTAARADWDKRDINFSRERTLVARALADLTGKAATSRGGVLNFAERMEPLRTRFERDFRDAKARMEAAAKGLKSLYGYDVALPQFDKPKYLSPLGTPDSGRYYDESLIWTRDAISFMVRFSQLEQNYVQPVSVRMLINDENKWKSGLSAGLWEFDLPLIEDDKAPANLFPYQRHVRLRGISAFVSVEDPAGVWQMTVKAPPDSYCLHLSDKREPLDQKKVPPIQLGRVATRENVRDPDIVGVTTLHNLSPFGTWSLSLKNKASTAGVTSDKIKDIFLDLHVAVQTKV